VTVADATRLRPPASAGVSTASPVYRGTALIFVAIGVVLRAWQYLGSSSMWIDEIAPATAVLQYRPWELLTSPIESGRPITEPRAFLVLQHLIVVIAGRGDLAFRALPFAASIAALIGFWRVASRGLRPASAAISTGLFALATPLIWQGAQAKPYAIDVLGTVMMLCAVQLLATAAPPGRRATLVAVALGASIVWLSYPALFVVAAASAWLVWHAWSRRWRAQANGAVRLAAVLAAWALAAAGSTALSLLVTSADTTAALTEFWRNGFPPEPMSPVAVASWMYERLLALFGAGSAGVGGFSRLGYSATGAVAAVILSAVGVVVLVARRSPIGAVAILAAAAHVGAAALHRYPFDDRLILYLLPLLFLAIGAAAGALESMAWVGRPAAAAAALVVIGGFAARTYAVAGGPVYHMNAHVKPALAYFDAHRQHGDAVYIAGIQSAIIGFYATEFGLAQNGFVVGGCYGDRLAREQYRADLAQFRGAGRLWLLFAGGQRPVRDTLVTYLDAAGRRTETFTYEYRRADNGTPQRIEAIAYDLRDLARFDDVTAALALARPPSQPPAAATSACPPLSLEPGRYERSPDGTLARVRQ
jgi:hypothetical protein